MAVDEQEIKLRQYEALREYALSTYEFFIARWNEHDAKVQQLLRIIVGLLAAGAFTAEQFKKALLSDPSWLRTIFVHVYGTYLTMGILSFFALLWALSYQRAKAPQANSSIVMPYFGTQRYVDVLVGLSESYLEGAREVESALNRVQWWAYVGYSLFLVSLVSGLLSVCTYVIMFGRQA